MRCVRYFVLFVFFLLVFVHNYAFAQDGDLEKSYAISVYGGVMTDDNWRQSISGQAGTVDSYLLATALSWRFYTPRHHLWALELEGNIARHFGIQDHFEFNLPIITVRWLWFPWNKYLETSIAYGIGPSYATTLPEYERMNSHPSDQFLLFWHLEADFRVPGSAWAFLARLHHRSSGYGLMARSGGGNVLTMGLRYNF